MKQKTLTGFL